MLLSQRGRVEAPKLDAIFGIVNMPERTRDLRWVAVA
jgi:hypothetical protein